MFIVWGSRTTKKLLGNAKVYNCGHCNNANPFQVICVKNWFTLFWIPIFPTSVNYFIMCPICGDGFKLKKEQAMAEVVSQGSEQSEQTAFPNQ